MLKYCWCLPVVFRWVSTIPALPLQYHQWHHWCQYTPFKAVPNGSAEAPAVSTPPPVVGINFGNSFAFLQTCGMLLLSAFDKLILTIHRKDWWSILLMKMVNIAWAVTFQGEKMWFKSEFPLSWCGIDQWTVKKNIGSHTLLQLVEKSKNISQASETSLVKSMFFLIFHSNFCSPTCFKI